MNKDSTVKFEKLTLQFIPNKDSDIDKYSNVKLEKLTLLIYAPNKVSNLNTYRLLEFICCVIVINKDSNVKLEKFTLLYILFIQISTLCDTLFDHPPPCSRGVGITISMPIAHSSLRRQLPSNRSFQIGIVFDSQIESIFTLIWKHCPMIALPPRPNSPLSRRVALVPLSA